LLFLNAIIGYVEEARAESAVDALRQTLALKTRCWREGHLTELDTSCLVPGDVIVLRLGDIVPADAKLLGIDASGADTDGDLLVDQSALTGESLAVRKKKGDEVYSSTVVKKGQQRAIVAKTGIKTYLGMAAHLIATTQVNDQRLRTIAQTRAHVLPCTRHDGDLKEKALIVFFSLLKHMETDE